MQITVRLKDPSFELDGQTYPSVELMCWQSVQYVTTDRCKHIETMCKDCRPAWETDYDVRSDGTADPITGDFRPLRAS